MYAAWRVMLRISALNLTGGAFAQIAGGAAMSEAKVARLRASMLGLQMAVGALGVAVGSMFLRGSYDAAGKFQLAMTNVGIAAGASAGQVKSLSGEVLNLSNITAQSAVTTAGMMAIVARSGLNNPAQLSALFPQIAKFADVQQYLTGSNRLTRRSRRRSSFTCSRRTRHARCRRFSTRSTA